MVNHHGPLPLKELHSTGETIVWRDPGGSWACLPPVYHCVWNHTAAGCECDMWTKPEKHTTKIETLRIDQQEQNHKKSWVQDGGWQPPSPPPTKEAFRIKGTWWNTEESNNTNNNSQKEDSQRKSPTMNQSNWKGTPQKPLWQEQSPTQC